MKTKFYAIGGYEDGTKTLKEKTGDIDKKLGVCYVQENKLWNIYDVYSGSSLVVKQPTKEASQNALKKIWEDVKKIRATEKYLKSVINYKEMIEDK